jgi:cation transport ATPase
MKQTEKIKRYTAWRKRERTKKRKTEKRKKEKIHKVDKKDKTKKEKRNRKKNAREKERKIIGKQKQKNGKRRKMLGSSSETAMHGRVTTSPSPVPLPSVTFRFFSFVCSVSFFFLVGVSFYSVLFSSLVECFLFHPPRGFSGFILFLFRFGLGSLFNYSRYLFYLN